MHLKLITRHNEVAEFDKERLAFYKFDPQSNIYLYCESQGLLVMLTGDR
jgi:hypothetical protein